jgi:hypothetical protein
MTALIGRMCFLIAIAVAAMGCAADQPTPAPTPTEQPTISPTATPDVLASGPLSGTGKLSRATYATPDAFKPSFSFSMESDAWVSATKPDQYGFILVTPNLIQAQAIIALLRPASTTVAAFEGQLASHGLDASNPGFVASDLTVGEMPARSFSISRSEATDAFDVVNANGTTTSSIGGPLSENELVYVTTADGPFLLVVSLKPSGGAPARFVFKSILASITFD